MAESGYLTSSQFAERAGVSQKTLVRWDRAGKLKPAVVTIGNHRRYTEEQLLELKERGSRNGEQSGETGHSLQ